MYSRECVVSAGRAVLEMMQFDWEPLSQGELEQRLDQAVEEILEADLIERARAQVGPVGLPQSLRSESPFHQSQKEAVLEGDNSAVQLSAFVEYVTDLLQNSDSSFNRSRLTGRARLSLPHTVLLSLTLLCKRLSYRSVSTCFRVEKGNIHRIFSSFCERVNALKDQQIRWPSGQEGESNLWPLSDSLEMADGSVESEVPKVFGILGHTRIPIRLPIGKQEIEDGMLDIKKMKKDVNPDSWLSLELVCTRLGRFLHCRISRGSDTDRASALKNRLRQQPEMVPPGSCLVARLGYPLSAQILTPFPAGCGRREKFFNQSLEGHLEVLDQAVAELKARFHRLQYLDMGNFERAKAVVLTACILHNVFLGMGDRVPTAKTAREDDADEEEGEKDEDGARRREAIADKLYSMVDSGSE